MGFTTHNNSKCPLNCYISVSPATTDLCSEKRSPHAVELSLEKEVIRKISYGNAYTQSPLYFRKLMPTQKIMVKNNLKHNDVEE